MEQYQDRFKYIAVGVLAFVSFLVSYSLFHSSYYPVTSRGITDRLSGEKYAPIISDRNPYAPYTVGFEELTSRGVSRDEMRYINDVLTNFTLYEADAYKAKVSYVKDSFTRTYSKSLTTTYSFKFGINDSNIKTMVVSSNSIDATISIKINDSRGKVLFSRDFVVLS